MNLTNIISVCIACGSLLFVVLNFGMSKGKDHDAVRENNIKMNLKLDQLCSNTTQILLKIDKHDERINGIEKEIAVIKRDLKTAFSQLDDMK